MMALEQLALSGATTLLTYLQCDRLTDESVGADAIAATLCELLNQLESDYPGVTDSYGWHKVPLATEQGQANNYNSVRIDRDRYNDLGFSSLS